MREVCKKVKGGVLSFIRRALGTSSLTEKVDALSARVESLSGQVQDLSMNQSFNTAYALYEALDRKIGDEGSFNKDTFDVLLLLTLYFSESTRRYSFFASGRGLFQSKWVKKNAEGVDYLDVKGVKLTGNIPHQLCMGVPVFDLIFQRSLFVHAFFDDNYDKRIVETLDQRMGEGARGYTDGRFDVTVKNGDIVIDAGAWVGDFSAYAAYKGATVYAFEPTPETYALLSETAQLNDGKIRPVQKALSDVNGKISFCTYENSAGNRLASVTEPASANMITLEATSLDAFVEENNISRVDFIKADIQGGERDMLKGALNVLRKFAPRLVIATDHLPDDPIVLEEIIRNANPEYTIVQLRTVLFAAIVR